MSHKFSLYSFKNFYSNKGIELFNIISIFERKEKFLSLKIFFHLFEESKFRNQLGKIYQYHNDNKFFETLFDSYISDKSQSINKLRYSQKAEKIIDRNIYYTSKILKLYTIITVFL